MEKNQIHVIKIGGNIIDNPDALNSFLTNFALIPGFKILVHGGGKIATQMAKNLGIETQMVDGRRVTDEKSLQIVTMVYAGWINKSIVANLQSKNCNAMGLTGPDGGLIKAKKRNPIPIDFGFVGDIVDVNAKGITDLNIKYNQPIIFGVLTPDNLQQAIDRAGGKHGNKCDEAAITAIKMLSLRNSFTL